MMPWTPDDLAELETGLLAGESCEDIGVRLGRTEKAVRAMAGRAFGGIQRLRHNRWSARTAQDVAGLFGVTPKVVLRWVATGTLCAQRRTGRSGATFRITDAALLQFLGNAATWMCWSPEQIRDPAWRNEAWRLRQEAGEAWVKLADVARCQGYSTRTALTWIESGVLPREACAQYGRHWYVWSAALDSLGLPANRRPGACLPRAARQQTYCGAGLASAVGGRG